MKEDNNNSHSILQKTKSMPLLTKSLSGLEKHNSQSSNKEFKDRRFLKTYKKNWMVTTLPSYKKPYNDIRKQFQNITTNKEDQKHRCLDSTPSSSTINHIDSTSINLNNNQPLFYPEGWNITRRTTQAFFEKLETSNNPSVALISSRERLQTSIFEKPNPLEEQSSKIVTIRTISNQHSSGKISTGGDHSEITNTESSILIDFLHDTRRDKATANSELYKIESVPSSTTLQNGGCTSITRYSGERRFFVQDRLKGCIRRGADSSGISEILNIRKWRITPGKGYPSNLLSRRHLHHGKVQRKDEADGESNTSAFGRPWIPNQQGKECVRAEEHSRISWISFQHTNNEDIATTEEDKQTTATFTTSREVNSPFVPMDSQFAWKDDSSNSSNWRSLITHTSPTTRSREEPTAEQSQLGQDMPDIPMGEIRDSVVEDVSDQEKRTTDTTGAVAGTISYNLCGRIRCRMGSLLKNNRNIRVLELRRQRKVYKRARAQGDLLCSSNARKKIKQHGTSHLQRQQNGPQIRHKSRGNSFFRPSRFGGKDSRPMQPTPVTSPLSTYSGSREYQSRSIESSAETNLRDDSTSEDVSATLPDVGKNDESRRVRSLSQLSTTKILELSDGSVCGKDRRVSTELETERPLHVPSVEINSKSFTENESRQNKGSSPGHPTVEKSILVSHDSTFQSSLTTNRMEDTARELEFNRLAVINNKRKSDGMNEGLIDHLNKAIRLSTNKTYDGYWKKYVIWCQKKDYDAEKYDIQQILQYLSDHNHLQYSTLNGYRSAIASVLRILYPQRQPVAENTYIVQFFQAKKCQEVKLPSETSLETWDVKLLVDYICKELSPTDELTLYDLQQKTILLLCLHTMWRPRSDIGRIQHRDVHLKYDTDKKHLEGVTIHVREPKESQQKFTKLGLITDNTQQEVCVVKTLEKFMQKTADIRKSLPQEHSLFLTYLQDDKKDEESKGAAPSTIANWIKTHMKKAGINEAYKPHSIRSAVSTKAVMLGNSIEKVKDHANWSQASNTFEKYYYKPTMKQYSSTKIQNSIFAAENNTTSESEAKATRIVLGTSNNTTVAEAKDEEVVQTRPWYRRLF